jgi:transposase-like protein
VSKSLTESRDRQLHAGAPTAIVQLPLPVLASLEDTRRAFFGLCVTAGKQVLEAMMEADRTALCGPAGRHDRGRVRGRAGSTPSRVVLGGREIALRRLRVRSRLGQEEFALPSFVAAAQRDPLDAHTLAAIAAGVSTRSYARSLDALPAGEREASTSRSAVSRRFVALTAAKLGEWFSAPLGELDLCAVMIDGIHFHDHCVLLALGIGADGTKHALGLREGTTENATVAKALLADLVERGLCPERPLLFVIDGARALRKAVRDVFGATALVHRCQVHKLRNVLEHLPERLRPSVKKAMHQAWASSDAKLARRQLERLASSLAAAHPSAAASLREGLEETLTLQSLGVSGALYRTLRSTNAIENLNGLVAKYARNVRRWRGGSMMLRWVGAALSEARRSFHRIRGHGELSKLVAALSHYGAQNGQRTHAKVA